MDGGRQDKGIPGFAETAKQMAGQISNGQYKGAMQSGGNYLSGVAGTFANRMKMVKDGTFKSPYYEALREADRKNKMYAKTNDTNKKNTTQNTNDSNINSYNKNYKRNN